MKSIKVSYDEVAVSAHAFDHIEGLHTNDILNAVCAAHQGFRTIGGGKLPTIRGYIGEELLGFIIDEETQTIITVLTERESDRNQNNHNSLKSVVVSVEVI